ncbi:response regulator [Alteromonas sp. 5E99-2]|uniref:response regulator n=1 Tax=Alteromonas sp. 5E99-2 TaxID=2817683 RepID=UPI001A986BA0|nr:response regulator [Alteromonas sp. 5E99-2]MBO1255531.1 response regulator [Alteromonas sp. 5E99-2]
MDHQLRLAIVEDNATARTNLRSNLLPLGLFDIYSFSNGNELRSALKRMKIDVIIIDYHLGQHRNGVDCVHSLLVSGHIKPSTGIIFMTGERSAKNIGQIMDLHPDVLILKPYTMAVLLRHINHYIESREILNDVKLLMDAKHFSDALKQTKALVLQAQNKQSPSSKFLPDLNRLFAQLLVQNGFYTAASKLYDSVLQRSHKVLWAHWGKIKCQFFLGEWQECESTLKLMLRSSFTRDRAFEWLASLSIEEKSYSEACEHLDNINVSNLSISATKLKTFAFRKQNKVLEGISLLQKQREHNRSVRELFDEFTCELAEFYIAIAEETPKNQRSESLSQARKLIGMGTRGESDLQLKVQREVLIAYSATLEGDIDKAKRIIEETSLLTLNNAHPSALFTAAKVFHSMGDIETAKGLLAQAEMRLTLSQDQTWLSVMNAGLIESEKHVGIDQEKAVRLNEEGMLLFSNNQAEKAMPLFYSAYQRISSMPAFSLNLLQCMVELGKESYRHVTIDLIINEISQLSLNATNEHRFKTIKNNMGYVKNSGAHLNQS